MRYTWPVISFIFLGGGGVIISRNDFKQTITIGFEVDVYMLFHE